MRTAVGRYHAELAKFRYTECRYNQRRKSGLLANDCKGPATPGWPSDYERPDRPSKTTFAAELNTAVVRRTRTFASVESNFFAMRNAAARHSRNVISVAAANLSESDYLDILWPGKLGGDRGEAR